MKVALLVSLSKPLLSFFIPTLTLVTSIPPGQSSYNVWVNIVVLPYSVARIYKNLKARLNIKSINFSDPYT